jgi:hypothetical protein
LGGAWIVVTAIPILIMAMSGIARHYDDLARQLGHPERRPADRRPANQHFVILVDNINSATARAIGYARSIRPASIAAIALDSAVADDWHRMAPDIRLTVVRGAGGRIQAVKGYLRERRGDLSSDDFLTLVVPEVLRSGSLLEVIRRPTTHRLKAALLPLTGVQVMDVPMVGDETTVGLEAIHEPARNHAVVLVSGVHNSTLQAIEYAETMRPTDLRAVTFGLEPEDVERLGNQWIEAEIPHPLEVEDAPYRDIGSALTHYIRQFKADGVERMVTLIIPEFVVSKRRHQLLHGQTALIIKRHMLFEPGVVVVSVPYHIERNAAPVT